MTYTLKTDVPEIAMLALFQPGFEYALSIDPAGYERARHSTVDPNGQLVAVMAAGCHGASSHHTRPSG